MFAILSVAPARRKRALLQGHDFSGQGDNLARLKATRCRDFALRTPRPSHPWMSLNASALDAMARSLGTRPRCKRSKTSTGSHNDILSAQTGPTGLDRQADRALADNGGRAFAAGGCVSPWARRITARLRGRRPLYSWLACPRGVAPPPQLSAALSGSGLLGGCAWHRRD